MHNKSVWILEGILMYFTCDEIENLFHNITPLLCENSKLYCDQISETFFDKNGANKNFIETWTDMTGSSFKSFTNNPEALLSKYGFDSKVVNFISKEVDIGRFDATILNKYLGCPRPLNNEKDNLPR